VPERYAAERYLEAGIRFVGNDIARPPLPQGGRVGIFDNCPTDNPQILTDLYDDVEPVEGDLRPRDTWRRAGKGVTYLIQQAALSSLIHHWPD